MSASRFLGLTVSLALFAACASPDAREQKKALRGADISLRKHTDSEILRAVEEMKPLTGVIWSWPKASIELVKAPPETNWRDRELIFWVKESIAF